MAVCASGSVLVFFIRYLTLFQLIGGKLKKDGSGCFSWSGADDHQLILLYGLTVNNSKRVFTKRVYDSYQNVYIDAD